MPEIPRPQRPSQLPFEEVSSFSYLLEASARVGGLTADSVTRSCDLGCGIGYTTKALVEAFPFATVDAVDYHNTLDPRVRQNPRIRFHHGLITDVIASGILGYPDLVVIKSISRTHGFNEENIELLRRLIGSGILITGGENNALESRSFFTASFEPLCDNDRSLRVWRSR